MSDVIHTPIEYLKGVGPQKAELLKKELGIYTFKDLLNHFPFRYIDKRVFSLIKDAIYSENYVQIKGFISQIKEVGVGKSKRLIAIIQDDSGKVELVWFQNYTWIKSFLKVNELYKVFGKIKRFGNSFIISHPEISILDDKNESKRFKPIYSSTEKLNSKYLNTNGIEKLLDSLLPKIIGNISETLPSTILKKLNLIEINEAYKQIHSPDNENSIKLARYRLKFEELFYLQIELLLNKKISFEKTKGFIFKEIGNYFNEFYSKHLPFELTNAQKKVIREIRNDCRNGFHMNRLVQGDVGSGKTMVAFISMLIAIGNGFQAAMMAPTEILAQQHFESILEYSNLLGIKIKKLSGISKKKERIHLLEELKNGDIDILIGTHAILEETVVFRNLGLVVIDEQHRFGVSQRAKLWKKNKQAPHILVMTATPIPRTLAMTLYGDLDVSIIDELPPGRKPITTLLYSESKRSELFGFMRKEINLGRQIYIVYPLIEESENLDYMNLYAGYESITRSFPLPKYKISIVHGKLKPEVKEFEMQRFVKGETQIMVATTVIEVGVNVPNASVMIIESSERFGLSQLHQLRGRVGRGSEKSYCILMTGNKLSNEGKKRLNTMVRTQDGFEIAEVDLEIRGPGDLMGTQQSGLLDLKIANIAKDGEIVSETREFAKEILTSDPNLEKNEHEVIKNTIQKIISHKQNWSIIS